MCQRSWTLPCRLTTNILVGDPGGDGTLAGEVTIQNKGAISTAGDAADGIFAQAIGGNSGDGGPAVGTSYSINGVCTLSIVALYQCNPFSDKATSSPIVSISAAINIGGCGTAGASNNITELANGYIGNTGDGGDATVTVNDTFAVSGNAAHGVFAQSVGGPNTKGGKVAVKVNADVTAGGANGRAILVQSAVGDGAGSLSIDIAKGFTVASTANSHEAVAVLGGDGTTATSLTNLGTIIKVGGAGDSTVIGHTIAFTESDANIINSGCISGSITRLSASSGGIENKGSGLVEFGASNSLGNKDLTNTGTITAGAADHIATANFAAADSSQRSAWADFGTLQVDYQLGDGESEKPSADRLAFTSGDFASIIFAGEVKTNATGVNMVDKGTIGQFNIISGANRTFNAIIEDSAIVKWEIKQTGSDVFLAYGTNTVPWSDFQTVGYDQVLTADEQERANNNLVAVGDHIDELVAARIPDQECGSSKLAWADDLTNYLLGVQEIGELVDIYYEGFSPQIATAPLNTVLLSSIGFAESLRGCPRYDETG